MTAPGNIGAASINVGANASGFSAALQQAAQSAGTKVSGALSKGFDMATTGLKATVTTAFTAAGVAGVAAITKIVNKGLNRLAGLDSAQQRFEGLGIAGTQLDSIMKSVDKAVTDTAFGLDTAAQAASMLATSGVQAGRGMDSALKALVTLSAAAGNTDQDMAEITAIMQKVAADSGQLGMAIRQLQIRGVNATAALAQSFKVSEAQISQMVKNGEISFDQFNKAVTDSLGGMALAMGKTADSMQKNLVSRLGKAAANIEKPFVEAKKTLLSALLPQASEFAKLTSGWTYAISKSLAPVVNKIADFISRIDFSKLDLSKVKQSMTVLVPIVGALGGSLGGIASKLPLIGGAFAGLTGPIGALTASLLGVLLSNKEFQKALGDLFNALKPLIGPITNLMGSVASLASTLVLSLIHI